VSSEFRALVVDDDDGVRYTLGAFLSDAGVEVTTAVDGLDALDKLEACDPDLVLTDLRMPRLDGMGLLAKLVARPQPPLVVMITANGSERDAIAAVKLGAFDYFRKPFEPEVLEAVIERARAMRRERQRSERLEGELALAGGLVSSSPAMARLAELVARVAPRDVTVLITGESGTGKERVAEAIVRASRRRSAPFVRFNCAALTHELAEAELFGHAKGAFTGAHKARTGLFREANGGTLLLDEIGELDPRTQAKLLRTLQEGEVRPVGEDRAQPIDVRILAATHRDLPDLVQKGAFREDLYYRLKVVQLRVPPLRERSEDVPALARHFFARFAARFGIDGLLVEDDVIARLSEQRWPGNVRELENTVESLVALSADGRVDTSILDAETGARDGSGAQLHLKEKVEAFERGVIVQALKDAHQNRTEAARRLGVSRATLHEKLTKYGIGGDP
jgi:two-component system, NtrC family, response regulator HydG